MLPVPVHQHEKSSSGCANAALDGGPVADVIGVADHVRSRGHGDVRAAVRRTVVNHDDFRTFKVQPADCT